MSGLMNTYARLPVSFSHGEGAYLFDAEGKRYLDAIGGIAVNSLGHAHAAISDVIAAQAQQLIHTSNLYGVEKQEQLAYKLCAVSGMEKVFFGNSGAEANEAAIKLARLHGHNQGIENPAIIVMDNAFHGRTMATLTASGNRKIQAGFEPLLGGFVRAPFGDMEALQHIAANNSDVVAVLVEPIQGEGGINVPPAGYLKQLRELCDQHHWLMMLDEVQTGNGRTGRYFAYQHEGLLPDVVTTAKGLGNGLPIGACLARGEAAEVLGPGNHGSTYGGNPLVCAVASRVIETLEQDQLIAHAEALGNHLLAGFCQRLGALPQVKGLRGKGLMIGIELDGPCGYLVDEARAKGLLINVAAGNVIRLLPPMILSREQADVILDTVAELVDVYAAAA